MSEKSLEDFRRVAKTYFEANLHMSDNNLNLMAGLAAELMLKISKLSAHDTIAELSALDNVTRGFGSVHR